MIDVHHLRQTARSRARTRPKVAFGGSIDDRRVFGVLVRSYVPADMADGVTILFCHGGYGVFGDLDLQDGYCRRLAHALGRRVVAVDYRLAPEHTLHDAVEDLVTVAQGVASGGGADAGVVLFGDSAGGAVAMAAARDGRVPVRGLVLTNPNLDLTLNSFDRCATDGPDWATTRAAFTAWVHPTPLDQAPRLHAPTAAPPAVFLAVGAHDALLPEARSLDRTCRGLGSSCELHVLAGRGHGFMGDPGVAGQVLRSVRSFVDGVVGTA